MSEEQNSNGVANPDVENEREVNEDTFNSDRGVSYESHKRLLGEKKKLQAKYGELSERLAEFEAEKEAERQKRLKEEGKFSEIVKEYETKYSTLENQLNSYKTTVQNSVKFNAIKRTLGAEIDYKWADLLEAKNIYSGIEMTDDGRPEEMSVTKVCDFIKKEYPELIKTPGGNGKLPYGSPQGGGKLSYEDWLKLPSEEMKQRIKEVMNQ